jgi:hypothetical protein
LPVEQVRTPAAVQLSIGHDDDVPDDGRVRAYYETFKTLAEVYLEDSWVLKVDERGDALVFDLEAVLMERHTLYEPPRPGEMYCYRRGLLVVRSPQPILFRRSGNPPTVDPDGEQDYGNIDTFTPVGDESSAWEFTGDWGEALVVRPKVELNLNR